MIIFLIELWLSSVEYLNLKIILNRFRFLENIAGINLCVNRYEYNG